jgi:hypothetical protein
MKLLEFCERGLKPYHVKVWDISAGMLFSTGLFFGLGFLMGIDYSKDREPEAIVLLVATIAGLWVFGAIAAGIAIARRSHPPSDTESGSR